MYYFNSFLFNNLPKLFGLSEKRLVGEGVRKIIHV